MAAGAPGTHAAAVLGGWRRAAKKKAPPCVQDGACVQITLPATASPTPDTRETLSRQLTATVGSLPEPLSTANRQYRGRRLAADQTRPAIHTGRPNACDHTRENRTHHTAGRTELDNPSSVHPPKHCCFEEQPP